MKSKFVTGGEFSDGEEGKEEEENEAIDEEDEEEEEEKNDKKGKKDKKKTEEEIKEEENNGITEEKERNYRARSKVRDQLLEVDYGVYKKGLYVRIEVENIKFQYYKRFKPDFPIILCRINPAEDTFGFLKVALDSYR